MNMRLVVGGIVLIAVIIFGFWFAGEFYENQQELANTPLNQDNNQSSSQTGSDSTTPTQENPSSLQSELNALDLSELDKENFDLSGL